MCSAAKVRCNKNKPICGRCERLGYPCFYSPNRRIRKPRSVQSSGSLTRTNDSTSLGSIDRASRTTSPESSVASNRSPQPSLSDCNQNTFIGTTKTLKCRSRDLDSDDAFNPSIPNHEPPHCLSTEPDDFTCLHPENLAYVSGPFFNTINTDVNTLSTYPDISNAFSSCNNISQFTCNQATPTSDSNKLAHDCAANLTILLQSLSVTSATPSSQNLQASVDQIRTILICPCSLRANIALFLAATCLSLIDTLEYAIRTAEVEFVQNTALRQVATLVSQFAQRYSRETESEVFTAVAASVVARFQGLWKELGGGYWWGS